MTNQHTVIPCRVGIEFFKRQLFVSEILKRSVGQLITAAFMIATDNAGRIQITIESRCFQQGINGLSLADIGLVMMIVSGRQKLDVSRAEATADVGEKMGGSRRPFSLLKQNPVWYVFLSRMKHLLAESGSEHG